MAWTMVMKFFTWNDVHFNGPDYLFELEWTNEFFVLLHFCG